MQNVISIATAKPEIDTDTISKRIAQVTASIYPDKKVLYISCRFDGKIKGKIYQNVGIYDDLLLYEVPKNCNMHVLCGKDAFSLRSMTPDIAEHLVKELSHKYDVVICNAGDKLENGLALGCLFASESVYYLLDNRRCSIKKYGFYRPLLEKLDIPVKGHLLIGDPEEVQYSYNEYLENAGPGQYLQAVTSARMDKCLYEFAKYVGRNLWPGELDIISLNEEKDRQCQRSYS